MLELDFILKRAVSEIISEEELRKLLASGKKLRLKEGFDPSSRDIHLGHMVGLRKLRQLQELGHQVVLIVGDWTAQIGDPTGASVTRPILTAEQVRVNAETYMQQFFKIVDNSKTEVRWQSEWFGKFLPGRCHQAHQPLHHRPDAGARRFQKTIRVQPARSPSPNSFIPCCRPTIRS